MIKFLTVIGARPQIIKAAALSRTIYDGFSDKIEEIIVHTGQHYDNNMSGEFFVDLEIPLPKYNLGVGSGYQGVQTARMIEGIENILLSEKPDYLVLYGDTNSTLAGAVAASKLNIPIVHIEAGLRSFNRKMPEEVNRVVCDHLSSLLFSPTETGYKNLLNEGIKRNNKTPFNADNPGIFHCGDVMFDNSLYFSEKAEKKSKILNTYKLVKDEFVLSTIHRDYNTDIPENLEAIFRALIEISKSIKIILPLHPRTLKILNSAQHISLYKEIRQSDNLIIISPASFFDMIILEKNASLIITDSGGVQKEAYFFNKACIVLRPETEWLEILDTGLAILAGADYNTIITAYKELSISKNHIFPEIFGDGKAAEFICFTILSNK